MTNQYKKNSLTTKECIDLFVAQHGITNVTSNKMQALSEAGAFSEVSVDQWRRYDEQEFHRFIGSFRYVTPSAWPTPAPLYRVSVLGLRENEVRSFPTRKHPNGKLLRTHAGADYANSAGLSAKQRRRAWTGVWSISDATAHEMIATGAIVYATTKGYIHPDYVRLVTDYERVPGGRVLLKTKPVPQKVTDFVGTGLWMDVKPGRENDWA